MHLRQRVTAHAGRVCPRGFRRNASDPAQLTPLKPEVGGAYASVFRCARDVGYKTFQETWDALRDAGKKLKAAKGRPLGQTAAHTFGDAPAWWYPSLWSWGGKEVEADRKTVVLNSQETIEPSSWRLAFGRKAAMRADSPGTTPATTALFCRAASAPPTTAPRSTSK